MFEHAKQVWMLGKQKTAVSKHWLKTNITATYFAKFLQFKHYGKNNLWKILSFKKTAVIVPDNRLQLFVIVSKRSSRSYQTAIESATE